MPCHSLEQVLSRRPLPHRAWPLRHQADQEGHARSSAISGRFWISKKKKDDAIENKYLFELNNRWTIDGSVRQNVARYINHACKPNAESDVKPRKRKVFIRAIKNIEPGDEINYDYGTDYFKAYLKPIGCKCAACEKKRKKQRAEARAEKARLKAKAERKALKIAEKLAQEKQKAAAKLKEKLKAKAGRKAKTALNGHSLNGKHLNGKGPVRVAGGKPAGRKRTASAPAPALQA